MSDAVRAKVEADPSWAIARMFSKMDDEDKETFNMLVRQARGIGEHSTAEQTAALRAENERLRAGIMAALNRYDSVDNGDHPLLAQAMEWELRALLAAPEGRPVTR